MKKIYFLLALFPFSLFADIDPGDLSTLEGLSSDIYNETITIKNEITSADNHLQYIRQMTYELLQEVVNADLDNVLWQIRDLTNGTNTRLNQIKDLLDTDFNLVLDQLESSNGYLFSIHTDIQYLKQYLETLLEYQELIDTKLGSLISSLSTLIDSLSQISTSLEGLKETVQNIYYELLSQGLDIKDILTILRLTNKKLVLPEVKTFFYTRSGAHDIGDPSDLSYYTISLYRSTNYFDFVQMSLAKLYDLQGTTHHLLSNFQYRLFDIQTNFYSSIKLQKDISTNVAYIASVITNSHDLLKLIASNVVNIARHTMPTNIADQYETEQQEQIDQISSNYQDHENDMNQYESQLTRLPGSVQNRFDDSLDYISRLSSSNLSVDRLDDQIFASLPDYHSSLANMSFSLPIDIQLTPDVKQIFGILRKCVTTTIWIFTFLFTLFMIQKFLQFVSWIMSLLNPITRDVFGNTSSGSLYRLMGG